MTQPGRKTGWRDRRRLHVIDAKAPVDDSAIDHRYDDACWDGWYGCREQGCCVQEDWAVHVMPSMTFMRDGIVHVSRPKDPTAVCGDEGNWPVPPVTSTDDAIAYARQHAGDFRQITCLVCIAHAAFHRVAWRAP